MVRHQVAEAPWWRLSDRLQRLSQSLIADVLEEIRERGPITAEALSDRGRIKPLSWNGWKGTARATSMAVEVLWTQCEIVVCGRENGAKLYDVPDRALPTASECPEGDFERWAVLNRVEAAGLLSRSGGATWSMLAEVRKSSLPDQLVAEGLLEEVVIEGSSRLYIGTSPISRAAFPRE